jgi:hypothetical protein
MPAILQKVIAEWRNRIEASFGEITDRMELARHEPTPSGPAGPHRSDHRRSRSAARTPR